MLTGTPAHAGERDWRTTTECTTGDLFTASYDTPPDLIVIHGRAALCTAPPGDDVDTQFAVVNFYPDSPSRWTSVERRNLRRYSDNPTEPRFFGTAAPRAPRFGACLMSDWDHRITCAEVTDTGGDLQLRRIPVDDPLVAAPVLSVVEHTPDPSCGTCF